MEIWEIALLGVALAMDACAVAMTDGMTNPKMPFWQALLIGVFFGFFQFLMPLIGYFISGIIAEAFLDTFEKISAWISFVLLAFLGGKMIFECVREWIAAKKEKATAEVMGEKSTENIETTGVDVEVTHIEAEESTSEKAKKFSFGKLFMQAIATSIDALAVGVTLQMSAISEGLALGPWGATGMIGVITFALAFGAVYIGKAIGNKLADKASFFGGIVLFAIGLKLLIEGLL